jgi:hypothetical protein
VSKPAIVILNHEVPRVVEPFSLQLQARAMDVIASVPASVDLTNADLANDVYKRLKATEKQIEEAHAIAKRPVIDLGKCLDVAKNDWIGVVKTARDVLGERIAAFDREIARQRAAYEAEQRAIREAEMRAEMERQRAEQAAEEARTVAARIEAQRQAALLDTDDPFGDVPDTDVAIPILPPAPPAVAVPVATIAPPPVVAKSAVKVTVRKRLVIHDASLVPRDFCVPDERAILDAMRGGAMVPGCELVDESTVGAK